jgi:hypothetical protein
MRHLTAYVLHFGIRGIRRTMWIFQRWRKFLANIYASCVKRCWRSDYMDDESSDKVLFIALTVLLLIGIVLHEHPIQIIYLAFIYVIAAMQIVKQ